MTEKINKTPSCPAVNRYLPQGDCLILETSPLWADIVSYGTGVNNAAE